MISRVEILVTGKKIKRFIIRVYQNKVRMYKIKYISKDKVKIIIDKKDLEKVYKIKSIYIIKEINYYGLAKTKKQLNKNIVLIISILICFMFLYILSNMIFSIEIVHNDQELRKDLKLELENYGIKEKSFKKSYNELQNIKEKILDKYKDRIEWLEIEENGTKYIIRLEERLIINDDEDNIPRNVIASKSAIIKDIIASSGTVVKEKNNYVNKGEVVISNEIKLYDNVKAQGNVYGEVWYEVKISYPFDYYEEKETGNTKEVYEFKIVNKNIPLFDFNKYENKKNNYKVILYNPIVPIMFGLNKQKEIIIINEHYSLEEAIKKAGIASKQKIKDKLAKDEYIINEKQLKVTVKDSKIELVTFYSVYENITAYQKVGE